MRLDDYDNDINVEDQRGGAGGGLGGGGGLLLGLLPMIGSRFGCGGIVVALLLLAVFGGLGNLGGLVGGGDSFAPSTPVSRTNGGGGETLAQKCDTQAARAACNALSSAPNRWEAICAKSGARFVAPTPVCVGERGGRSGCGAAMSAMGPFYCPTDQGIYLDTDFFNELTNRFKAPGDFAQYYVIAHEFGHHIQNLTGTSERVQQAQRQASEREGNALSVRLELQADCYAGVWAAANRNRLEPGDVEEGMRAAQAIGDDTLQREAQGRVVPDSFTHGTSAQRQEWLRRGMESGDPAACDTFSGAV